MRTDSAATGIFFLITLAASLALGAFLSLQRNTNPFLYYDTAFVESVYKTEKMVVPETGPGAALRLVPGRQMLMVQFANMMGVTPRALQFMPLGSIIVTLSFFLLGTKLLRSPLLASALALQLIFNLSYAGSLYSVFAYALALPILLTALIAVARYAKTGRRTEVGIICLTFFALHTIHYTITVWLILFIIGGNVAILLPTVRSKVWQPQLELGASALGDFKPKPIYYLLLAYVVFYLYFNNTLYSSFLPLISYETFSGSVERFLSYLAMAPGSTEFASYLYVQAPMLGAISFLSLLIVVFPSLIGFGHDLWRLSRSRPFGYNAYFIWGLLLLCAVDTLAYSVRGSVSTKALSMFLPFVALLYVQRLNRRSLVYGFAALLVVTTAVKFAVFYKNDFVVSSEVTSTPVERVRPSAAWVNTHITKDSYTMLASIELYGKFLVNSDPHQKVPLLQGFSLEHFAQLTGATEKKWSKPPNLIAVDMQATEATRGLVWLRLKPLRGYWREIDANPRLNVLYDDGAIKVLQPKRADK